MMIDHIRYIYRNRFIKSRDPNGFYLNSMYPADCSFVTKFNMINDISKIFSTYIKTEDADKYNIDIHMGEDNGHAIIKDRNIGRPFVYINLDTVYREKDDATGSYFKYRGYSIVFSAEENKAYSKDSDGNIATELEYDYNGSDVEGMRTILLMTLNDIDNIEDDKIIKHL